jgi:hypothetical protein
MSRNEILSAIHGSVSVAGTALNVALVTGFAWTTLKLAAISADAYFAAGGVPPLTTQALELAASDPALPARAADYVTAWFAAVGAAGCAFMTALGMRWGYHAISRVFLRLKD